MPLSFKILLWISLATIVSVFGAGLNTDLIDHYLPENVFLNSTISIDETSASNLNSHNSTDIIQPSIELSSDTLFNASPLNTPSIKAFITLKSNPPLSVGNYSFGHSFAGIDGTGGPQPIPNTGIDGTGGPIKPLPPELSQPIIATLGTLERQGQQSIFRIGGYTFTVDEETKTILDGITVPDTAELNDGHIAIIKGPVDDNNQGTAEQIIVSTQISGTITQITNKTITVLGQTIILHSEIIFGGTATPLSEEDIVTVSGFKLSNNDGKLSPIPLSEGDTVTISGFRLSNGDLSPTRIDKVTKNIDKLTGIISKLNETDNTFKINQLTVNYSQVADLFVLSNGMTVDITGIIDSQAPTVLQAESINLATSILDNDVEVIHVEGFITEFISAANFKVGDVDIFTDYETDFVGNDRDDLALNTKIRIEGYVDSSNTLIAQKVEFFMAKITSHIHSNHGYRAGISASTETFTWKDVNAKAYRLRIQKIGHKGFYDEIFDGNTTSATVSTTSA
jgi:hypothetical protein